MQHTQRIRCRIPCEIAYEGGKASATVVDLAEGGVGLVTSVTLHEADPIRVVLDARKAGSAIELTGIVWNERVVQRGGEGGRKRALGIMLSEVPDDYLALLARHRPRDGARRRGGGQRAAGSGPRPSSHGLRRAERVATSRVAIVREPRADTNLPRAKVPLPPPKSVPEECLPLYCARVKQVGGARTRRMEVRARSDSQARQQILAELGTEWEILELGPPKS